MSKIVIGVPKEIKSGEARVAVTPESAAKLIKMGFSVQIEKGAGEPASFSDSNYTLAGARVLESPADVWSQADLILKINPPQWSPRTNSHEADLLKKEAHLISFIWPAQNSDLLKKLSQSKVTALALDCIPRISRAQKMDVLSSMANIAGYRAVIEAAHQFGRLFTGQITAAGKMPPAKVLVIGAGVAGLAAVGAARALGAIVRAFDTRPEVKEQVKSMGAEFLELKFKEEGSGGGGYAKVMSPEFIKAEMELFARQAKEVDIIITTALIPGKKAPLLIDGATVALMKEGSVIVDMAAEQGGNCEFSQADQIVKKCGVTIIGYTNLASRLATTASELLASNLVHLLTDMTKGETGYHIDMKDEVIRGALILNSGEITWPPPAPATPPIALEKVSSENKKPAVKPELKKEKKFSGVDFTLLGMAVLFFFLGQNAPSEFLGHFSVFILAIVIGWQVVWNVAPALHTPLMSVTNAISGIIIIGALVQLRGDSLGIAGALSLIAVVIASINIAGGFLVTKRMLKMFHK
jgi:NAD(P) transhydrogenase subunit alpha